MNNSSRPILGVYGVSYRWNKQTNAASTTANKLAFEDIARSANGLDEVSFELARGSIVSLIGPNGSGKSTLMKLICGILPRTQATSGQVKHLGKNLWTCSASERARTIAYAGAEFVAEFPLKAKEAVSLGLISSGRSDASDWSESLGEQGSHKYQSSQIQWAMEKCFCWHLRDRNVETLSGGEKQRVGIARALVQGARILFLDEALSKMDMNHQSMMGHMFQELASEGWSILWVSHDLNLALEWSDSIILLNQGRKVAEGTISDVLTEANLKSLFPGVRLFLGSNPHSGAAQIFYGSLDPMVLEKNSSK